MDPNACVWKVRLRTRDLLRVMNCARRTSPKEASPRSASPALPAPLCLPLSGLGSPHAPTRARAGAAPMRMGGHGPPGMGLPRVTEEAGLLRRPAKEEACLPAALPRLCRGLCTSAPPLHLLCTPGVQCNLCRLHGKVMSMGVASCLQARTRQPQPAASPHASPHASAHGARGCTR